MHKGESVEYHMPTAKITPISGHLGFPFTDSFFDSRQRSQSKARYSAISGQYGGADFAPISGIAS